jgi:hypothetical protein
MATVARARRRRGPAGSQPLSPRRKWRTITIGTLLLVPAYWSILAGLVAAGDDDGDAGPNAAAALAFGLAIIPFVYVVVAFMSEHPRPPAAVWRAMGMTLLVGVPVSALAQDAVTGIVAGIGAGGIVALRMDPPHNRRARALAIAAASVYTFALVRAAGVIVLLSAPVFPLTAIGLADHLSERRLERTSAGA